MGCFVYLLFIAVCNVTPKTCDISQSDHLEGLGRSSDHSLVFVSLHPSMLQAKKGGISEYTGHSREIPRFILVTFKTFHSSSLTFVRVTINSFILLLSSLLKSVVNIKGKKFFQETLSAFLTKSGSTVVGLQFP